MKKKLDGNIFILSPYVYILKIYLFKMKKTFYYLHLIVVMLLTTSVVFALSSCESSKEDEPDQNLYLYPWVDYPQSYIKFFDYRMQLGNINVQRNGSSLQIDYTLTNVGFGREVSLSFFLDKDAGHDNLGNTYICEYSNSHTDVLAYINGEQYSTRGAAKVVKFMPNQTIKGSFTIKNFDINAKAFSLGINVKRLSPSDITLAYERIDFVNIPVPAYNGGGSDVPMM